MLISLLLFQKLAIFCVKIVLFPPIGLLALLYSCICVNKCRCSPKHSSRRDSNVELYSSGAHILAKPIRIDWRTNLGFDTYEEEQIACLETGEDDQNVFSDMPELLTNHSASLQVDGESSYRRNSRLRRSKVFKHRQFFKSNYMCCCDCCMCCWSCCMGTHRVFYHVQQWISLMYYDHNVYLQN